MTTDATRSNAEQWHIAPLSDQLRAGNSTLPVDSTGAALVAIIDREMQRLRDQVAVERTAAISAREALAACEAKLEHARCDAKDARQMLVDERAKSAKLDPRADVTSSSKPDPTRLPYPGDAARTARELGKLEVRYAQRCDRNAQLRVANAAMRQELAAANEARLSALGEANRYAVERDNALAELERERARFESSLSELRSSATEQTVSLVPGSVEAVIEAYRLLVGDGLEWRRSPGWYDNTTCQSPEMEKATLHLIHWLDQHAPGGKP